MDQYSGPELLARLAEAALEWCEARAQKRDAQEAEDNLVLATMAYHRARLAELERRADTVDQLAND